MRVESAPDAPAVSQADENLPLLRHAVRKWRHLGRGVPQDEWCELCGVAMWEAVRKHDPALGPLKAALWNAIRAQVSDWRRAERPGGYKHWSDDDPPPGTQALGGDEPEVAVVTPSAVDRVDARDFLAARAGRLDGRTRLVLALRYGFGGDALTQAEVGALFGLTQPAVCKIEARGLAALRDDAPPHGPAPPARARTTAATRATATTR